MQIVIFSIFKALYSVQFENKFCDHIFIFCWTAYNPCVTQQFILVFCWITLSALQPSVTHQHGACTLLCVNFISYLEYVRCKTLIWINEARNLVVIQNIWVTTDEFTANPMANQMIWQDNDIISYQIYREGGPYDKLGRQTERTNMLFVVATNFPGSPSETPLAVPKLCPTNLSNV